MFNADDAKKMVEEHFSVGEVLSQEWLVNHIEEVVSQIKSTSKIGVSELDYEISLEKEKYPLVKKKLLTNALINLKFKIAISEKVKREPMTKTFVVFTIAWS
jgi:hypothetical protein